MNLTKPTHEKDSLQRTEPRTATLFSSPRQETDPSLDPEVRTPAHFLELLRSLESPSLVPTLFPVTIDGVRHQLAKFLVLGKRAGGTPIRLGVFGGLEPGRIETVAATVKLLTLLTISPVLAADYAVFGYPCVDPAGFAPSAPGKAAPVSRLERWNASPHAADLLFFRSELQRVAPGGILTLRSTGESHFLQARVNSRIIAQEVLKPALLRMRHLVEVEDEPVTCLPSPSQGRQAPLHPTADTNPQPFEIELFAPATASLEVQVQVLVLTALDVLRTYRGFSCHGGDL